MKYSSASLRPGFALSMVIVLCLAMSCSHQPRSAIRTARVVESTPHRTMRGAAAPRLPVALPAIDQVFIANVGLVNVEENYLPHVVACENPEASREALRAQAVAARSYLYYRILQHGEIADGTSDQVYSCNIEPTEEVYEAVRSTKGEIVQYRDKIVCTFYVAGAKPTTNTCIPQDGDGDPHRTERFVTYNDGLAGGDVKQSTLGWRDPRNVHNRGCLSQNGASCLADAGWDYQEILNFYFGADIALALAYSPADGEAEESKPRRPTREAPAEETTIQPRG